MKQFNVKSLAMSWIVSYLIVTILSLTGSLIIYFSAIDAIKDNAIMLNKEILINEKQKADRLIDEVQTISTYIIYNENLSKAAEYEGELTNTQRHNMALLSSELTKGKVYSEQINMVYIYFYRSDFVISSTSSSEADIFYKGAYGTDTSLSKEEWDNLVHQQHSGTFIAIPGDENSELPSRLFYMKSVYEIGHEDPVATIVVELYGNSFTSKHNGNQFIVMDKNGEIFMPVFAPETKTKLEELKLSVNDSVKTVELGNDKYMVLYESSGINSWKYLYLIDYRLFMAKIYSIRWVLLLSTLLFFLIGGYVVTQAAKRNQKPIQNIIKMINKNMGLSKRGYNNELEFIELAIMNAIEENNASIKQRDITEQVVRESMLVKFLKDNDKIGIFNVEYLRSANIRFRYSDFVVVAISIEKIEDAFFDNKGTKRENTELSAVVIKNILNEMFEKYYDIQYCEIDGMIVKILNADYIPDVKRVEKILEKASGIIMENFNIEFLASISRVVKSAENLPLAYSQAMEAMNYRYIVSKNIIAYRDVDFDYSSTYAFSIEVEEQLISCLRRGEFEKGKLILDDIFESSINSSETPIVLLRCIMYDIVGTIVKLLNEMPKSDSNEMIAKIKVLDSLSRTTNVNLLKTEIIKLFREFCDKRTMTTDNKVENILEDVKNYINVYYFDQTLSVQMLADKHDINSSYLSTLFKKYNNVGLLEYITKVRMEKAKLILRTEDKTVEEVSEMTGYSNSRTFSRVFVKYVGITPGKYKKNIINENGE